MGAAVFYGIQVFALAMVGIAKLLAPASEPPKAPVEPTAIVAPAPERTPDTPEVQAPKPDTP